MPVPKRCMTTASKASLTIIIATGRYWPRAQSVRARRRIARWTTAGRPWALCRAAGHSLLESNSAASCMLQLPHAMVCYT